jgi:hypothetical protein
MFLVAADFSYFRYDPGRGGHRVAKPCAKPMHLVDVAAAWREGRCRGAEAERRAQAERFYRDFFLHRRR